MSERTIYITVFDMNRLGHLLISAIGEGTDVETLQALHGEVEKARLVRPQEIPPNVVTMNSKVRVTNLDAGEESVFTLVFPEDENASEGKISILSPIGSAVLGYSAGDRIRWRIPGGVLNLKVEEVLYQPEAAGNYRL